MKKSDDMNDLFDLVGTYKFSDKKNYDYEEIIEHMEEVARTQVEKLTEENKQKEEAKPTINLE